MRKLLYYILFLLLFVSCNNEEKRTNVKPSPKATPIVDSSTIIVNNSKIDSIALLEHKPTKNILEKEEKQSSYKLQSISELWQQYKSSKTIATKFISENKLDSIIVYLNLAADAAYKLSREDIATWQLNNIGYYSINEFKKITDYDIRMQNLATMQNLKKKGLYLEETKSVFRNHFQILANAENYLYKAQLLDNELEKSDRTEIINRNLQFIDWVGNFISDESRKNRGNFNKNID